MNYYTDHYNTISYFNVIAISFASLLQIYYFDFNPSLLILNFPVQNVRDVFYELLRSYQLWTAKPMQMFRKEDF